MLKLAGSSGCACVYSYNSLPAGRQSGVSVKQTGTEMVPDKGCGDSHEDTSCAATIKIINKAVFFIMCPAINKNSLDNDDPVPRAEPPQIGKMFSGRHIGLRRSGPGPTCAMSQYLLKRRIYK